MNTLQTVVEGTEMTDTQDLSHLRALAAEWLDRGCDVDDLRCEGGSTSVNKLMRAYVAETEPTKVIALLDKLESAQAEIERLECDYTDQVLRAMTAEQERDRALARLAEIEAKPTPNYERLVDDYLEEYELVGEDDQGRDGSYRPNETELGIIKDAFMGFDFLQLFAAAGASPEPSALQAENAKLITALAACRDAFPAPDAGSDLDGWYVSAIADPLEVPAYVKAAVESLKDSHDFYKRRVDLLQQWQSKMRDPERTICCDIIANGQTLPPENAGNRYAVQPIKAGELLDYEQKAEIVSNWFSDEDMQSRAMQMLGDIEQAINAKAVQPSQPVDGCGWCRKGVCYKHGVGQEPSQTGLSDKEIRKWWASENGLEDMDLCKIDDFTTTVRAIEKLINAKES